MQKRSIRKWGLALVMLPVCALGWWAGAFCGLGAATGYAYRGYGPHTRPLFNFFHDLEELLRRARHFPGWDQWEVSSGRIETWCGLVGLVAGGMWCLGMMYLTRRMVSRYGRARPSLIALGAAVGAAVGAMSSLAIHIGLQIYYGVFGWMAIIIGSLLGLTVGLVLGLPLGVIFWAVARLGVKKHA